jgi:capsular exopolysaccharide synthesis family protein
MADTGEVQLHFLDYWRVVKNRWGIITLTFLLVVVTAYITSYFLPREYYSKVLMEVKSDDYSLKIMSTESIRDTPDARFAPTQFQILHSKEIVYPVIDELRLRDKWAIGTQQLPKEQIFFRVLKMMNITEVRNTDLLEIGVFSTDPQEAANIANTVAVQYQKKRRDDQQQLINLGLAELEEEVAKQHKKVESANAEVAKIRIRDHLIDTNPETVETPELQINKDVATEESQLMEARLRVEELKTQLAQIEKMTPDELINSLALLNITDPTVSKILPLYQDTLAEEVRLTNSGIGENHPRLKSLRAQKDVYKKQLYDQIDSLRKSLTTRLEIAHSYLDTRQTNTTETEGKLLDSKKQSAEYVEAKNNYIAEKKILETAQNRLETEKMQARMTVTPAKIWEKAEPAIVPSRPNVPMYMAIAFLVGLVWGVGLAFFLEYLDTSVKTLADVEKFIGVSVLAVVPRIGGLLHKMEGRSPDAETYRTLRTNIEFHKPAPDANTITIISGGPGEGKSTTLCNLAVICANAGSNVLVVDADLRRPSQHKFFDMEEGVGLVNYVNGEVELEDVIRPTPVDNIWLISSGPLPRDPVAILNSHRMIELVGRTKAQFDVVLFDSPPILGLSDGAVLSSVVEMTVMVVQHRRFPRASLLRVKQAVLNVGGNLTGVVLNRVDTRDDQNYYYYTSYYDYYAPGADREKKSKVESEV